MKTLLALIATALTAWPALAQSTGPVETFLGTEAGYTVVEIDLLETEIAALLPPREGIFPAGNDMSPLGKALLAVIAHDGPIQFHRYALEASVVLVGDGSGGPGQPVVLVAVEALNLGEAHREQLALEFMPEILAPLEEFGPGPSSSWRIALTQVMGNRSAIIAASRRELAGHEAASLDCLGSPCTEPEPLVEQAAAWQDERVVRVGDLELPLLPPQPAAMLDMLLTDTPIGQLADAKAIVESSFAQQLYVDAAVRLGVQGDDSLLATWQRALALPGAYGVTGLTVNDAFECTRGAERIAPVGSYCP